MRHTGKTHALHTKVNSYWTYIQRVCGEADLRHLHVERALVVAQRAYKWTETASQYVSLHITSLPSSPPRDLV